MNENISSEYYFLMADYSYPTLEYRNPDFVLDRFLNLDKPFILPEDYPVIDFYLRRKLSKPKMVDYHLYDGFTPVVSKRLKEAFEETNPVGVQFFPSVIHVGKKEDEEHPDYFIVHCHNCIPAMDRENSVWEPSASGLPGKIALSVSKLVMDMDKLKNIPLSERRIFALKECSLYVLFHESVIEHIERLSPKGCYAVPVEDWYDDLMMDL